MSVVDDVVKDVGGSDREPAHRELRWTPRRQRTLAILIICAVVVLANGTYLLQIFNPNPINQVSGIGTITQPGLLPGQNNIDPNIGYTAQALGHRAAVDWLHGTVPWWNPDEGLGSPLAGEMQAAAFFPLNAFNLLPNGQVYFRLILEMVAGIATYLLLRRLVRSNLAAVLGGIAFALNGTLSWLFHAPGNPVAFLPLVLLGVEWAHEGAEQGSRRGWVLIAVSLALALYAGFPETVFIGGLLCLVWWCVRAFRLPRRSLILFSQSALLGLGLAVLLAAPILVAFADYLPAADLGGHNGSFANVSLPPNVGLPIQVMPYLFGPIFGFNSTSPALTNVWANIGGFLGASVTVLAIIGLAGRRHRPLRIALAGWVVLGLARLVGVGWALGIMNAIPGVRETAFYRYAPPTWELALVILAAFGVDDTLHRSVSRWFVIGSGVAFVAACLLGWHEAQPVIQSISSQPNSHRWAIASLLWGIAVAVGIVLVSVLPDFEIGRFRWGNCRSFALAGLVTIDVVAMFATPQFSAPRQAAINVGPVDYLDHHLGQSRYFTLGPLAPNYGSYFGLASVNDDDLPIPKAFNSFVVHHLNSNANPISFDGITMLTPSGPTPTEELMTHLAEYEAVGVKFLIVPPGENLPSSTGTPLPVVYSDQDLKIIQLPHPAPVIGSLGRGCVVSTTGTGQATARCKKPSTVVYRELNLAGWHASVNGEAVALHPYESIFQAVDVPAGTSTVQFSFTPPHAELAFIAFIAGCCVLLAVWLPLDGIAALGRRRRGRHGAPARWST